MSLLSPNYAKTADGATDAGGTKIPGAHCHGEKTKGRNESMQVNILRISVVKDIFWAGMKTVLLLTSSQEIASEMFLKNGFFWFVSFFNILVWCKTSCHALLCLRWKRGSSWWFRWLKIVQHAPSPVTGTWRAKDSAWHNLPQFGRLASIGHQ